MVDIQTQNVRGLWWRYKHRMLGVYGGDTNRMLGGYGGHTNTEC